MSKAVFDSERISSKTERKYNDITTLVVSNYGTEVLYVTVKGVKRPVPPVHATLNVPIAPFRIESFGHGFDVDVTIEFASGTGNAIIDIVKLKDC